MDDGGAKGAVVALAVAVGVGWWLLSAPQPPNRLPVTTTTEPPATTSSTTMLPATTAPVGVGPDNPYHVSLPQLVAGSLLAERDDRLIVGGIGQPLRMIDLGTGEVETFERQGAPLAIVGNRLLVAVDISDESSVLVVGDIDRIDDAELVEVAVPGIPLRASASSESDIALVHLDTPDGGRRVLVDLDEGMLQSNLVDPTGNVSVSPGGRYRLEWGERGELRVFRLADGETVLVRYNPFTPDPFYQEPAFSADGEVVAIVGNGVHLMDLTSGSWAAFDLDPTVLDGRSVFVPPGIR